MSNPTGPAGPLQKLKRLFGCWGVLLCLSAGCGYQFTVEGPGPIIGGGTDLAAQGPPVRLAMHTLKNNSFEPNLEFKYTRYLRQAMQSAGSAEFVDDDGSADFILDGAIVSVTLPSLAFSRTQTQESRVMVTVAVSIKDRKTKKIRWSQSGSGTAEFFVGATSTGDAETGLQFNRVLQDRAIEQAGQLVAADLADRFLGAKDRGLFQVSERKDIPAPTSKVIESPEPQEDRLPSKTLLK